MTHFAIVAILPSGSEVDDKLAQLMEPFDEAGEWGRDGSRWDWYVIGGRYTGLFEASYEPESDPKNLETCRYCEGGITTQAIADEFPAYGPYVGKTCLQCKGTTRVISFMHYGNDYPGDIKPVAEVDFDQIRFLPLAVLTPDGEWHERIENGLGMFVNDEWGREVSRLFDEHRDGIAVVVDCHV
jgi:hypothetical protein